MSMEFIQGAYMETSLVCPLTRVRATNTVMTPVFLVLCNGVCCMLYGVWCIMQKTGNEPSIYIFATFFLYHTTLPSTFSSLVSLVSSGARPQKAAYLRVQPV
ncbi:hypothetical protein EON63_18245 [archaeon]|nr:MAG: hypothetical protein EON63_18245 [archaeon]